ncbi:MAG: type II secretion system protein [Candidatus Wallbacteria bacterium]|nr:type II secretion system protein [Candidatus Wallbacteria bacterium]MBI4867757.1 type II secretion system protein [Candidatus Wallbacteria bacterium]
MLRTARPAGFSLVEVVLAVFLVGLAVIPIFTTLGQASRGTVDLENEALAVGLATEALEWVKGVGFAGWSQALEDGGRAMKLPAALQADRSGGRLSWSEPRVVAFKSDEPGTDVDYPESSIPFAREVVMTFVRAPGSEVQALHAVATVRWKLNVRGNPERRVAMELMLHGVRP